MESLSLGIAQVGEVSSGTHFCALYSGPAERDRLLYPFLEEGLRQGDKCLVLIDDVEPALVRDQAVGPPGPDCSRRSALLDVERTSDAYLRTGEFSVDAMVSFLAESVGAAIAGGFDLFRACGEMSWVLPGPPGWGDLFVYESSLNHVVEEAPMIVMCLYDLKKFGAEMLVEVLHTHPKVLLDGTVIDNPHYVHPTEYPVAAGVGEWTQYPLVRVDADGKGGTDLGWASLTDAELRVISYVSRGLTNREVAEELFVSRHTVDAHLKHIYLKLGVHSRVELTVLALQHGYTCPSGQSPTDSTEAPADWLRSPRPSPPLHPPDRGARREAPRLARTSPSTAVGPAASVSSRNYTA